MLFTRYTNNGLQYCYRISEKSKRNTGYFILYESYDCCAIWNLRIIESARGRGYGTRMLKEFLQDYNKDKPLILYVKKNNTNAIHVYEKVGFVIVDDKRYGYAWTMQYMTERK